MRKIVALILAAIISLSLCSCGKSENVRAVEKAISDIGKVTIQSGEAIANAERLYNLLTEEEKDRVKNSQKLTDAIQSYEKIAKTLSRDAATEVYEHLYNAAQLCSSGMDAIYGAWYFGIYEAQNAYGFRDSDASYFCREMSISVPGVTGDELYDAFIRLNMTISMAKYDWQASIELVQSALAARGDYNAVLNHLNEADALLRVMNEEYRDTTYYPVLVNYYSAVFAYMDFFVNPSGNLSQLAGTINSYESTIFTRQSEVLLLIGNQ